MGVWALIWLALQHKGLKFALADNHIKAEGMVDHLGDLGVMGDALTEVLGHPGTQPFGFADIDNLIRLVPK